MPLFVPMLHLAMLFLNVYDSYKTLKFPPASSRRNDGLPSVRAMTQRKRDMKGCLAVWIVWCCFAVYERFGEAIISLFIPFYDEFKSIVLLFLILTRARGAEPIYLHIIRPLLKPFTSTLDAFLELLLMIGDFIFALSTFPIQRGLAYLLPTSLPRNYPFRFMFTRDWGFWVWVWVSGARDVFMRGSVERTESHHH